MMSETEVLLLAADILQRRMEWTAKSAVGQTLTEELVEEIAFAVNMSHAAGTLREIAASLKDEVR